MLQLAPSTFPLPPVPAPAPARIDLGGLVRLCRRQARPIAAVAGLALAVGALVAAVTAPRYTASTLLLVDPRRSPIASRPDQAGERLPEPGLVDGQVEILRSEPVARAAARALDLAADADFLAPRGLGRLFGSAAEEGAERRATERLAAGTRVRRLGATQVIQVDHADTDPVRAARIADAIVEAYVTGEVEARRLAARRNSGWLQERLAELRGQASAADREVQVFRARHGIVDTARGLMSAQQLGDVNAGLVAARAATAEARARLDRVLAVSEGDLADATVAEALRNEVINRLRAQYLDLATREAELAGRYGAGSGHAAVVALRAQMTQIARSAREELRRLAEGARSDHAIALAREDSLARSLDALVSRSAEAGPVQVELRNLESAAGSLRAIYDVALRRAEEAANEETFLGPGARVVAPASVPARPSSPGAVPVLAAAGAAGLALGIALALLREGLAAAPRGPDEVEAATGLPCLGVLPERGPRPRRGAPRDAALGAGDPMARWAIEAPGSRFAETLRGVAASLDAARAGAPAVLGIVSAVPGEGKTAVAANLALLMAASGRRTLLVDADLRGPALTGRLRPEAKAGLADLLGGQCSLGDLLCRDPDTRLDFLPSIAHPDALSFLASSEMAAFVAAARARYDVVVVDLPPLLPVADVRAAAGLFSHVLLVAAWGSTSREALREAVAGETLGADALRRRMVGVVLNRAPPHALARLEAHRGAAYARYYREATSAR